MKISEQTLIILKNFSGINNNLLIQPGNVLTTKSVNKNVVAQSKVTETFPLEFGIYSLSEFLGVLSLFKDPDLQFNDIYMEIKSDKKTVKYFKADPSVLVYFNKEWNLPEFEMDFNISNDDMSLIMKTARILNSEDISFIGDGKVLRVEVGKANNSTANRFELELGKTKKNFQVILKTDNMKFLPLDFKVSLASAGLTRFVSNDLIYYLVVDAASNLSGIKSAATA